MVGLVGRNKRRYGGYIVHLGIVLMFLGFAGSAYKLDEQVLLKQGQTSTVGKYTFRNDGIKVQRRRSEADDHGVHRGAGGRQADRHACIRRAGCSIVTKIRRPPRSASAAAFAEDLYVVMPSNDPTMMAAQMATLQIVRQPAGELDLARVRHHGVRHRHRDAA